MAYKIHGAVKVVFVHQDGNLTGSAFSMVNMIRGFKDQVEVHVVLAEPGPLQNLLKTNNITHSIQPFIRFWTAPGPRLHEKSAYLQLKALKPDSLLEAHVLSLQPNIIHLNDKACLQAGISLKGSGIPIIQHLRSSYHSTHCFFHKKLSAIYIKSYASHIVAISEDELDGFENEEQISIVFNTVETESVEKAIPKRKIKREELGINDDELVIGYAANISGVKGAWDFLETAKRLKERWPKKKLRFIMAGKIASGTAKKSRLERLGLRRTEHPVSRIKEYLSNPILTNNVKFLGFRNDILEIIAAMDILVVCTRLGVLGRQPFEAMALKTPVVVTSGHSGRSRVVLHENTGLVSPMNDLDALSKNVARLIENPVLRGQLAENGYKYAHLEFNPIVNSRKILNIYQQLTPYPFPIS